MAGFEGATIDDIYEAFAYAETGTHPIAKDTPWIRTTLEGSGSSAYGPVQLTGANDSMIHNQIKNNFKNTGIDWTEEEKTFMKKYRKESLKRLVHGGMKEAGTVDKMELISSKSQEYKDMGITEATVYDSAYDYGGAGNLDDHDKKMYEQVAKKFMKREWDRAIKNTPEGTSPIELLKRYWRFGNETTSQDSEYFQKFDNKLKVLLKNRKTKDDTSFFFPDGGLMPEDIPV